MIKKLLFTCCLFASVTVSAQSSTAAIQDNNTIESFKVRPNPASNFVNIILPKYSNELNIEVYDVLGKRIHKGKITKLESQLQVSSWKSGVYLVRISDSKTTLTKRLVIQ
ncbi:T9SS type A sorting domain-containing protein [Winogradskyella maritima]|uniref:T9SS type A sorting domain-containing protein n=1 Tax=Winogradskyella maritima TaxID=1517766 RepID=A0ABV8AI20_9FLAO|nr:T9SS type A sorting domain-containing protein [Winogradskyella maritima]